MFGKLFRLNRETNDHNFIVKGTIMAHIFQLKVTLDGTKPPVWRRMQIASTLTFYDLHTIIQEIMPWDNYHLHMFTIDWNTHIESCDMTSVAELQDMHGPDVLLDHKIKLSTFLKYEKQKIQYTYDFGDSWDHTIMVEKIIETKDAFEPAVCLTGKRNAPLEDCGGIPGYYECLECIKNPKNVDEYYSEFLEDTDWEPEHFDLDQVNTALKKLFTKEGKQKDIR